MLFQLKGTYQNLVLDSNEGKIIMKYVSMDYLFFIFIRKCYYL